MTKYRTVRINEKLDALIKECIGFHPDNTFDKIARVTAKRFRVDSVGYCHVGDYMTSGAIRIDVSWDSFPSERRPESIRANLAVYLLSCKKKFKPYRLTDQQLNRTLTME